MIERLLDLLGKVPTTPTRIVMTLAWIGATAAVYLALAIWATIHGKPSWEPSQWWLGFLAVLAGVDAAQFFAKRSTDIGLASVKAGNPMPMDTPAAGGVVGGADPKVTT